MKLGFLNVKKSIQLACFVLITLSTTLSADANTEKTDPEIYSGGFTLETGLNASLKKTTPALTIGYIGRHFLFDYENGKVKFGSWKILYQSLSF